MDSSWKQSVGVNPVEGLRFTEEPQYLNPLTAITIHNSTSSCLMYKVKTTHPNNYKVNPNVGLVPPHASGEVKIEFVHKFDSPVSPLRQHQFWF